MAKKKHKKNTGMPKSAVRLSQCMIVKNEERNIDKALSWCKDIVCEQIVVDTGSTDRTVEIAESMGAKVFHFEWIKDFAAAKNYAIEQASGNWIAFLDADEYMEDNDAKIVIPFLNTIMSDPKMRRNYLAVCCPWIQLNDEGQPKEILEQERIFQNLPNVRYVGKIHEKLSLTEKDVVVTCDFRIMHTGYTSESFIVTGKASRNIELLRAQLAENPGDIVTKAYLAESLRADAGVLDSEIEKIDDPAKMAQEYAQEVNRLYAEVLADTKEWEKLPVLLKKSTYEYYIRQYTEIAGSNPEMDRLCQRAYKDFPKDPKFMCYYAMSLNKNGKHTEAMDILRKCEQSMEKSMGSSSVLTTKVMGLLTAQMVQAAQGIGDVETVLSYAEIMLMMDKGSLAVLRPYIYTLTSRHESVEEVLGILARVYDLSSKQDLLTIARAAKDSGAINLARRIIDVAGYLGDS